MDTKRCNKCEEIKPTTEFYLRKTSRDGFKHTCKACVRERQRSRPVDREKKRAAWRRYYANNTEKVKEKVQQYCAENPEKVRERKRRQRAKNPEKAREYARLYVAKNPEKVKEYGRRYHVKKREIGQAQKQRRRARKQALPYTLTAADWQRCLDYFNGCCAVCNRPLKDLFNTHTASADHWTPLVKGGGTTADNIIPLCYGKGGCNNSKGANDPIEWLNKKFGKRKAQKILDRINEYFAWVKSQDENKAA